MRRIRYCEVMGKRFDLERAARKDSRELGVDILIIRDEYGPCSLEVYDDDTGIKFNRELGPPSKQQSSLSAFHEAIYRERGREVFRRQGGLCAICGQPMRTDNVSTDHIESRGAHGRNDRIENLRVCHEEPCHRERHQGKRHG